MNNMRMKDAAKVVLDADNAQLTEMRQYAEEQLMKLLSQTFKHGIKFGVGIGVVLTLAAYAVTIFLAKAFNN